MESLGLFKDIDTTANDKSKDLFVRSSKDKTIPKSLRRSIKDSEKYDKQIHARERRKINKQKQIDNAWEKRGYHQTELFCNKRMLDAIIENIIKKFLRTL